MRIEEDAIRPKALEDECTALLLAEVRRFFLDGEGRDPDQRILQLVNCRACDGTDSHPYLVRDGFHLVRCASCGLVFVNPRPTTRAMIEFFAQSKGIDLYSKMVEQTRAARLELTFQPLADRIIGSVPDGPIRLLEVGCGSGLLLETLAEQKPGWTLRGIEPGAAAVEICRTKGLDVFHGTIEEFNDTSGYDAVVFWGVTEHLFDPWAVAVRTRELLVPGGLILIGVLNLDGFDWTIVGEDSDAFTPPARQNFFAPASMRAMLERAGFHDITVRTTGTLDVEVVKNYWAGGGKRGRSPFLERVVLGDADVRDAFQRFLTDNNLSGHMTVTASKRP